MSYLETVGKNAKKAFEDLKDVKHKKIKKVLDNYNQSLLKNSNKIIRENLKDVKNVKRKHLVDRLILNKKRIESIRHSINEIAKFKDPVGRVLETWQRPNKLSIKKVATPIGVIGVIYESRPNVTADVAALCLKKVKLTAWWCRHIVFCRHVLNAANKPRSAQMLAFKL